MQRLVRLLAHVARQEVLNRHADVLGDLAQQRRRNVATLMKRHCCSAPIGMPKLSVRAALPNLDEPQRCKKCNDLARLEDGHCAHDSRHFDGLRSDEDALETRIAFFEQHLHDFLKVGSEFI
jgi:hypothetical protein